MSANRASRVNYIQNFFNFNDFITFHIEKLYVFAFACARFN